MDSKIGPWLFWGGLLLAGWYFNSGDKDDTQGRNDYSSTEDPTGDALSRDDAIDQHWDEIRDYMNGIQSVEACSSQSGNCYSLDAEVSGGNIHTLHFPSGGYGSFSADIDADGSASDSDSDGDSWDFQVDMESSTVDDAVSEWAEANGHAIE
jgi:hypothetical protein